MANGNVAKSEHQKKVETQNKITNLLLVANAGVAVAQSRRIKKLSKTFDKLQNEATKHTEILESINKNQDEMLQHAADQTTIQRLEYNKRRLTEAAKEAAFQFHQRVNEVEILPNNLEKFIECVKISEALNAKKIKSEDLPDIKDKQYFFEAKELLKILRKTSCENFSNAELKIIESLTVLEEKLNLLNEMQIKRDDYQTQVDKIENLTVREIAVEHNIGHRKRLLITYRMSIFLFIISILLGNWGPSEGEKWGVIAFVVFCTSILFFVLRFFSGIYRIKYNFDGTNEEMLKQVEMERVKKIIAVGDGFKKEIDLSSELFSFDVTSSSFFSDIDEAIDEIKIEFDKFQLKYPGLDFSIVKYFKSSSAKIE